jgi:hypothetical protein
LICSPRSAPTWCAHHTWRAPEGPARHSRRPGSDPPRSRRVHRSSERNDSPIARHSCVLAWKGARQCRQIR